VGVAWVPRIGSEFAGYRLDSLLGHGGMSIVYRAEHLSLGRTVALKLLAPELSEDEAFRERFLRESRMAAGLDHPNVIPIYEAGEESGCFYIAMRYVEGSDLKTILKEKGPLDGARTVSIIAQVASALAAAHAKGLVHRDVKPANILIASGHGPEESDHVYLSDFGVVKHQASQALTRTGVFVGTAEYAAPEQIEGKTLDGRADVYALGCVTYECLAAMPVYDKDSEVALMYAHLLEPPPPLTQSRPELPPAVDEVIGRAMAKSPDERYQTPRELAAGLRQALFGDTQVPAVTGAVQQTVLAPGAAAPDTAPPTAVAGDGAPAAPAPPRPERPAPPPPPPGRGGRRGLLILVALLALLLIGGGIAAALLLTGGDDNGGPAGNGGTGTGTGNATLLSVVIPTQVAKTCQAATASRTVEAYKCTPASGANARVPDDLELTFYDSAALLETAYANAKKESGVDETEGRCNQTHFQGEGTWEHPDGNEGGRRFCYVANDSVIVWTHEKLGSTTHVDMLGIAREPGRGVTSGLFTWWRSLRDAIGKCREGIDQNTCEETIEDLT
jgi:serine/threonine-protein kinase